MAKKQKSEKVGSRKKPKAQVAPYSIAVGLKKGFPVTKKVLKPRPASTKGVSTFTRASLKSSHLANAH